MDSVKRPSNNHVRFGEDAESTTEELVQVLDSKEKVDRDSDSNSSDNEVPEEDNLNSSRDKIKKGLIERKQMLQLELEQKKQKRRQKNLKFVEQIRQKREEVYNSTNELDIENQEGIEVLNEKFFNELEMQKNQKLSVKPTKINFNDLDNQYTEQVKAELKQMKRRALKSLSRTSLKRGPVHVSLLSSIDGDKKLTPKKVPKVLNIREKWLQRRSLNRK